MKRALPLAAICLLFLTGCARTYIITLNNGERITSEGKPKLVNGHFVYKDASGRQAEPISSGRVTEVAPASMATPGGAAFKSVQSP